MTRRHLVGLGAAACAACCAVPLLAAIVGVAALGVVGAMFLGIGALLAAALVIAAVLGHRRDADPAPPAEPVTLSPRGGPPRSP